MLSQYEKETEHNYVNTGPTNLFEMETDPIIYF